MVIIILLLEIVFLNFFKLIFGIETINGNIIVLFNMIVIGIWIYFNKKLTKKQRIILLIGFFGMSIIVLLQEFISLPYSTGDVEGFQMTATNVSEDLSLLSEKLYCAPYTKIMGIIYYLVGVNSTFIININMILMIASIYYIFVIINKLKVKENVLMEILLVFLPQSILLSCSLLRESLIIFLITLSLKLCVEYFINGNKLKFVFAIIYVLLASTIHTGIIFLCFGYIFLFAFYDYRKQTSKITMKKILVFSLVVFSLVFVYNKNSDMIGNNISKVDLEKVSESIGTNTGGSAYLRGVKTSGIDGLLLFTAPKTFYFMFSPIPLDWRGITDIILFFTDSVVYIYLIYTIIKYNKKIDKKYRFFVNSILLGVTLTIIVYALGTSNSGTAIRHRHKFLTFLTLFAMISKNSENKITEKEKM